MFSHDSRAPIDAVQRKSMLNVRDLAIRWSCSTRHVRRLITAHRIPQPIKLGSLIRWPLPVIEEWEREGCPKASKQTGGSSHE